MRKDTLFGLFLPVPVSNFGPATQFSWCGLDPLETTQSYLCSSLN